MLRRGFSLVVAILCKLSYILTQAGVCNFIIYLFFILICSAVRTLAQTNHFRYLLCEHLFLNAYITLNFTRKNPFILLSFASLIWFFSHFFCEKNAKGKNSQPNCILFSKCVGSVCLFIHLICSQPKNKHIFHVECANESRVKNYQLLQWIQHCIQPSKTEQNRTLIN